MVQIHVFVEGHAAAMNLQDGQSPVPVWNRNCYFTIEPARPPQRRIKGIRDIGGPNDNHILAFSQAIHQGEKLRHDSFFDVSDHLFALRSNGVDLIQENDTRSFSGRLFENLPQMCLALSVEFMNDLRTAHREKICFGLVGNGSRNERLPAAGRAMEKDTFWCVDTKTFEYLGVAQREFYHFPDSMELRFQSANVLIRDRHFGGFLICRFSHI